MLLCCTIIQLYRVKETYLCHKTSLIPPHFMYKIKLRTAMGNVSKRQQATKYQKKSLRPPIDLQNTENIPETALAKQKCLLVR